MNRFQRSLIHILIISLASLLLFTMCNENTTVPNNDNVNSEMVGASECKSFSGNIMSFDHSPGEDCIDYFYDGSGTLLITHVNAGFNCCPGDLTASITIVDNVITFEEHETEAACRCDCLYDLEYRIENLSAGAYTIKVIEPYAAEAELLEFTIDLISDPSGSFCVTRTFYPWGEH